MHTWKGRLLRILLTKGQMWVDTDEIHFRQLPNKASMGTRENFVATKSHLKLISTEKDAVFSGATVPTSKFSAGSAEGLLRGRSSFLLSLKEAQWHTHWPATTERGGQPTAWDALPSAEQSQGN